MVACSHLLYLVIPVQLWMKTVIFQVKNGQLFNFFFSQLITKNAENHVLSKEGNFHQCKAKSLRRKMCEAPGCFPSAGYRILLHHSWPIKIYRGELQCQFNNDFCVFFSIATQKLNFKWQVTAKSTDFFSLVSILSISTSLIPYDMTEIFPSPTWIHWQKIAGAVLIFTLHHSMFKLTVLKPVGFYLPQKVL